MSATRSQWPHTVDDIEKALDGVWGVVSAIALSGNLLRLERSLSAPVTYKFFEFRGTDEKCPIRQLSFPAAERDAAIGEFARLIGLAEMNP
jgi:hypothetical protein